MPTQIALNYSAAQINAAIEKILDLVSSVTPSDLNGNIVWLYDGDDVIYPRTKAEAVFLNNDPSQDLGKGYSQLVGEKGYYVCESNAGDNKQIIFASAYPITLGSKIRLLVKMNNINTRSNPTFQINSTTPKPLYYNGSPASSTNSWAQNEVLDIYYDGTNYVSTTYGGAQFSTGEKVGDVGIGGAPGTSQTTLMTQKGATDLTSEYNISANNNNAEYTFAQAIALVPTSLKKGGLTIKYIDSSTHKYVVKHLTSSIWDITESNWQDVSDIKTFISDASNFYIQDENDYVVLNIKNGHIKTKNFDSSEIQEDVETLQEDVETLQENAENLQVINGVSGDLSFVDNDDYILVDFKNGHIKTKNFDSSNIEYSNLSDNLKEQINPPEKQDIIKIPLRKSIKVLFIGNSISQDHATYIPWLLSTLYNGNTEDKIDYTVGIFYIGSHRIDQYAVEDWDALKAQIWSIADNTPIWTNTQNVTSLNDALAAANWDIISIQGYFNTGVTDDVTKAVQFVSRLRQQVQNNFKLAYLIHQTYRGDSMFKTILEAAATVIQQNEVSVLFAPGLANEYAKQYFTNSQLTPDSTHNREGLPCMIGAYECLSAILQDIKTKNIILGDTNILTLAIWQTLNIPGPNGTMDESLNTQKNYEHIQECAIFAFDKANMLLENLKTSNIYNYVKVNFN